MSEKRFTVRRDENGAILIPNSILKDGEIIDEKETVDLLNNQQATIEEYKDFCLNLCKFLIQKGLVDEYREKYGKEYKIITKWWNDE